MKLRELPGALALGLLASVLGHLAGYGDAHVMGGAYHAAVLSLAAAGMAGFALALIALALVGAGRATEGSILASRLAVWTPGAVSLALATFGWFAATEALEGAHASGNSFLVVAALVAAAIAVHWIARRLLGAIASLAIAIFTLAFHPRVSSARRHFERPPAVPASEFFRRRFARPPPNAMQRP